MVLQYNNMDNDDVLEKLQSIINEVDGDGNGSINYVEFKRIMSKGI